MFTGLIQALGTLEALEGGCARIRCVSGDLPSILQDLAIGDSIAVDGICLTVVTIESSGFIAAVSPETLRRSTLGQTQSKQTSVNLEASLRVGSKLGGHFVTGHVDGIGCLQESVLVGNSWEMCFTAPPTLIDPWQRQIAPYIVPKGSIAINGISLTVAECDRASSWFKVAVIPHTYDQTNLRTLQPGSWVNLEGDILGKYVEKFLHHRQLSNAASMEEITPEFLAEHGYF